MSTIEDLRKLLQDMVAPDLQAVSVRLDAVERSIKEGFETAHTSIKNHFDATERSLKQRFEGVGQCFDTMEHTIDQRFDSTEKMATVRHEAMLLQIEMPSQRFESNQTLMPKALDVDRHMDQLEAHISPKPSGPALEQHA